MKGNDREHSSTIFYNRCHYWQLWCEGVQQFDISWIIGCNMVEIRGGFDDVESSEIAILVKDIWFARWCWADDVGCQWEKMLESEGERVFKQWENGLREVQGRVREFVEEKALYIRRKKPWHIEESEMKRSCGN